MITAAEDAAGHDAQFANVGDRGLCDCGMERPCGCDCLLVRLRFATTVYIVSLVAIVVQFGWILTALPMIRTMGFAQAAGFPIFIAVVGTPSVWFARLAARRSWLR